MAEAAPDIYREIEDIVHDNHMSIVRAENHNLLTSENESESINLLSAAISTTWQEHDAAFSYIPFAMQGSNIFHLTPRLVQEFRQTDIGGTPIGAIIGLPYEHFYIHFGPQRDLILKEGVCVEGAYINRWVFGEPDRLGEYFVSILVVGRVMDLQPENILRNDKYWFKKPESNYRLELFPETSYDEIDSLIEKGLKVIEERLAPESAAKEKKIATERMIKVVDKASDEYLHETRANIGVFRAALKIALNAIFFINTYPEDIVSEVDAEEFKEQLAEKKSRKARRRFKEKAIKSSSCVKKPLDTYSPRLWIDTTSGGVPAATMAWYLAVNSPQGAPTSFIVIPGWVSLKSFTSSCQAVSFEMSSLHVSQVSSTGSATEVGISVGAADSVGGCASVAAGLQAASGLLDK